MPRYFRGPSEPDQDSSWFVYLMPYIEQAPVYNKIHGTTTGTYVPYVPAVYDYTGITYVPQSGGTYEWQSSIGYNGVVIWQQVYVGGTPAHWDPHDPVLVTPASGGYWIGGSGPSTVWANGVRDIAYPVLVCPSDPTNDGGLWQGSSSVSSYSANYLLLAGSSGDGSTTYGNWNPYGLYAPPKNFNHVTDGLSNTVLFGEVYSFCYDRPRYALYSWYYHDFGLTQGMGQGGWTKAPIPRSMLGRLTQHIYVPGPARSDARKAVCQLLRPLVRADAARHDATGDGGR